MSDRLAGVLDIGTYSRKMTFLKRLFLSGIRFTVGVLLREGQEYWASEPPDLAMAEKGVAVQDL
jgi:hypothetical protein